MNINLKKSLFVLFGLSIIIILFLLGKQNIVEASLKDGQRFDDWTVTCNSTKDKKKICILTQQVSATKKDKVEVLAIYQIGYFESGEKLKMVQILPLGVNLLAGTTIFSGEKLIAPAKYEICTQIGCQAVVKISDQDLDTILSSANNFLMHINSEGEQVNWPISNKGLKEGLDALKKDKK